MEPRLNPLTWLDRLRSTYWFLPAVLTGSAVGLAMFLTAYDRWYPDSTSWLGFAYAGGASGARALLSAVAGSTITVVSVTFSVMVVALTVSSQHFGPRLLNNFMRDQTAQLVLGTFTGTFAYCLVVLRTVQGDDGGDAYDRFVPHLAVTVALVLTLVSVAMLIYYVHHIAVSMQVAAITTNVAREFERAIDRLYPEPIGESADPPRREAPHPPAGARSVRAPQSGYVQAVNSDAIMDLAGAHETTIWLRTRPGAFVVEGAELALAHPTPADHDAFADALGKAFDIGGDRTTHQDVGFAAQQLVEVALRALSPGVNEPFTALTCIDRLTQGLSKLAARRLPSAVRSDDRGAVRAIAVPVTFAELLDDAIEPIALYGERNPAIAIRLLQTLQLLAEVARRPEDCAAIAHAGDFVMAQATAHIDDPRHRETLARLHRALGDRLRSEREIPA